MKTLPSELSRNYRAGREHLNVGPRIDRTNGADRKAFGRYLANELLAGSDASDRFFASVQTEWAELPKDLQNSDHDEALTIDRAVVPRVTAEPVPVSGPDRPSWAKWVVAGAGFVLLLTIGVIYLHGR